MQTDTLFYELFKADPQSLFELVDLDIQGNYFFESITVKTTEKRLDGFFKRTDGKGPIVFLEVQGYDDPVIFWRLFRVICTWYEQSRSVEPYVAIVLFINPKFEPQKHFITSVPPCRFVRCDLPRCLKTIKDRASALTVLKPLAEPVKGNLAEHVRQWYMEIQSLGLSEHKTHNLIELLEYAVLQRFSELTLKELKKMLQLTPLEKTVAGKELIFIGKEEGRKEGYQEGRQEGRQEGELKGELIGKILMLQRFLNFSAYERDTLLQNNAEELQTILDRLEAKIK